MTAAAWCGSSLLGLTHPGTLRPCSPIQDLPLGHHLSFRDPDGIALELNAPTPVYVAALEQLRTTDPSDDEVRAEAAHLLGPEVVARP